MATNFRSYKLCFLVFDKKGSQCFLLFSCLLIVDGWLVILENINTVITRRSLRNILRQYWAWATFLIPPSTQAYPADQLPFTSAAPITPSSLFHNYISQCILSIFSFYILKIYVITFCIFPTKKRILDKVMCPPFIQNIIHFVMIIYVFWIQYFNYIPLWWSSLYPNLCSSIQVVYQHYATRI